MGKMQSVRVGSTAARLFRELPEEQVGWLAKAVFALLKDGTKPASIPADCAAAWIAIDNELSAMRYLSELRSNIGRKGGIRSQEKLKQDANLVEQNANLVEQSEAYKYTSTSPHKTHEEEARLSPPRANEDARSLGFEEYAPIEEELRRLVPARVRSLGGIYFVANEKGMTAQDLIEWATYYAELGWRKQNGANIVNFAASVSRWAVMKQTIKERDNANTRGNGGPQGNHRRHDGTRPLSVQRGELDPNDPINTGGPLPF